MRMGLRCLVSISGTMALMGCGLNGNLGNLEYKFRVLNVEYPTTNEVKSSGQMTNDLRVLPAFDRIQVSGSYEVVTTVGGDSPSVMVVADSNYQSNIQTEVRENTLRIDTKDGVWFDSDRPISIIVNTPTLRGAGSSGSSELAVIGILVGQFDAKASGASKLILTGQADTLDINASGASSVRAQRLVAQTVNSKLSGASKASVHAAQSLSAKDSGASGLKYSGTPQHKSFKTSGASRIDRL